MATRTVSLHKVQIFKKHFFCLFNLQKIEMGLYTKTLIHSEPLNKSKTKVQLQYGSVTGCNVHIKLQFTVRQLSILHGAGLVLVFVFSVFIYNIYILCTKLWFINYVFVL